MRSREAGYFKLTLINEPPHLHKNILAFLAKALVIVEDFDSALLRLELLLLMRWPVKDFLYFTLPEAVTLTLLLNPLWVFCLGICQNSLQNIFNSFNQK